MNSHYYGMPPKNLSVVTRSYNKFISLDVTLHLEELITYDNIYPTKVKCLLLFIFIFILIITYLIDSDESGVVFNSNFDCHFLTVNLAN